MSPTSPEPNNDFETTQDKNELVREQLVAYLDGELSDEQSQAIERQISSNESVKEEIQSLDQAWNALDALPLQSTNHQFTQSTIAMVTMAANEEVVQATTTMPALRRKRRWGTGIAIVCFLCAGFLLSSLVIGYQDRQLIRHLSETRYAKTLNQIGDIEFLKAWSDEASKTIPLSRLANFSEEAETWSMLSSSPPAERFRWAEALPPDEMSKLSDQSIAFQSLTDVKQNRLSKLDQQLSELEEANQLRHYALLYEQLVAKLPPIEQASLRNMPDEERINRMRKEVRRQQSRLLIEMTDEEQRTFRRAIDESLERIDAVDNERADNLIQEYYRRRYPNKTISKEQILLFKLIRMARLSNLPTSKSNKPMLGFSKAIAEIWESIQEDLLDALPPRIQDEIQGSKNKSKQLLMLSQLIGSTMQSTSVADASTYFSEELTQREQLEYLSLTKEEMQEKLEERFSSEMFEGLDARADFWNERRARPGPPRRENAERRPQDFRSPRERQSPPNFNQGPRGNGPGPRNDGQAPRGNVPGPRGNGPGPRGQ